MLSDEEREAIESLKNIAIYIGDNYTFSQQGIRNLRENLRIVLPVIEKQSKEIEHQKEKRENQKKELAILNAKQIEFNKLVNTVNSYKGQFKRQQKEIEELKEENKKYIVQLTDEQYRKLVDIIRDETGKEWEDKIKAKIEEVNNEELNPAFIISSVEYKRDIIKYLQSLLEKE